MLLLGLVLGPAQAQTWKPAEPVRHQFPNGAQPMPPKGMSPYGGVVPPPPPTKSALDIPLGPPRGMEPAVPQGSLDRVVYQPAPLPGVNPVGTRKRYEIELTPPGPEKLFRLDSEEDYRQRLIQEELDETGQKLTFPEEAKLTSDAYYGRSWPKSYFYAEPNYVLHRRLYFEEMNAERYGWEFGIFQPILSSLIFYKDVLLLPYHVGTAPCRRWDGSAGKCMPGDAVPYRIYPPELSASGAALQTAVIATLFVVFP